MKSVTVKLRPSPAVLPASRSANLSLLLSIAETGLRGMKVSAAHVVEMGEARRMGRQTTVVRLLSAP
jgi:hypothetical protein